MDSCGINAMWVRRNEAVESVAARLSLSLQALSNLLDISEWNEGGRGNVWPMEDPAAQFDFISNSPMSGDNGEPLHDEGWSLHLGGEANDIECRTALYASDKYLSHKRSNSNFRVSLSDYSLERGRLRRLGSLVVPSIVDAFEPLVVTFDGKVNRRFMRGGWEVPPAYVTWVSSRLGEVAELPQGFTSVEYNGGTLVSADTGLSEIEVGERVLDLWERSGMREVPHPERTILPGEEWSYQLPDGSILG